MTPEEEERGWEALRARWGDDEAHRAFLAGFTDLEGLARAGRRYRAARDADPSDPVAARWIGEVLKRATAAGLASLPRTRPATAASPWVRRLLVAAASSLLAATLWWAASQLFALLRGR